MASSRQNPTPSPASEVAGAQKWTPEQLAQAERAKWILYGVMFLFIILPFIFNWLTK